MRAVGGAGIGAGATPQLLPGSASVGAMSVGDGVGGAAQESAEAAAERRAHSAQLERSFSVLDRMQEESVEQLEIVFRVLIEACGRLGSAEKALHVLKSMASAGFTPDSAVYSCLVRAFSMDANATSAAPLTQINWNAFRASHQNGIKRDVAESVASRFTRSFSKLRFRSSSPMAGGAAGAQARRRRRASAAPRVYGRGKPIPMLPPEVPPRRASSAQALRKAAMAEEAASAASSSTVSSTGVPRTVRSDSVASNSGSVSSAVAVASVTDVMPTTPLASPGASSVGPPPHPPGSPKPPPAPPAHPPSSPSPPPAPPAAAAPAADGGDAVPAALPYTGDRAASDHVPRAVAVAQAAASIATAPKVVRAQPDGVANGSNNSGSGIGTTGHHAAAGSEASSVSAASDAAHHGHGGDIGGRTAPSVLSDFAGSSSNVGLHQPAPKTPARRGMMSWIRSLGGQGSVSKNIGRDMSELPVIDAKQAALVLQRELAMWC